MNRASVFTAALSVCAFATGAAVASPILPGYWESTDQITFPIQSLKTSHKCITEAQIESYMNGPINKHYSCHYSSRTFGAGAFSMAGDCVDNNGLPSKIKVDGVYTATSFKFNGVLNVSIGGLTIPVTATTDAHRLSAECPVEAPK